MKLRNMLVLALSVAVLGNVVTSSAANSQSERNNNAKKQELIGQLNLSPEQIQKLKTIRNKYHQPILDLSAKVADSEKVITQMMSGDGPQAEIKEKFRQLIRLKDQNNTLRFASMLEMREVLKPQQRLKLAQLVEQQRQDVAMNPVGEARFNRSLSQQFQLFFPSCSEASRK